MHIVGVCTWYGIYMFWGHVASIIIKIIFRPQSPEWESINQSINVVGFIVGVAMRSYHTANKKYEDAEDMVMTQEEFDKPIE